MMRSVYLALVVAIASGIGSVSAQDNRRTAATGPSMSGVVKAVSALTVTLESDGETFMFTVDASTSVVGKRATVTNDLVYRGPNPKTLKDFVKTGDRVTVTYRQSDSGLTIKVLRVN